MDDERRQILQMVADGRITAEQANELFSVLDDAPAPHSAPEPVLAQGAKVRRVKRVSLTNPSTRNAQLTKLTEARMMGVTAEYIREMSESGFPDLTLQDLIEMRTMGVTPEYVRELAELGVDLEPKDLIHFRAHGMTAEFVRQMKESGLLDLAERDLGRMRAADIAAALDEETMVRVVEDDDEEESLDEER